MENNPAIIHGGPFGNIAHGCNSVLATTAALKLGEYAVTEAGFGADLGAEKFFDIKCRKTGLVPAVAVIVATVRALKMHGGVGLHELDRENVAAVNAGFANLARHISNVGRFGVPVVVAVNSFAADTAAEFDMVAALCSQLGVEAVRCTHFAEGGKGAVDLAEKVVFLAENASPHFSLVVSRRHAALGQGADNCPHDLWRRRYRRRQGRPRPVQHPAGRGYGAYPICFAKTQYSFSTDPNLKGAPTGHLVPIRELRLAAGAEFIVAIAGDIMTMPGLPRVPAANRVGFDAAGNVVGLF